MKTLNLLRHAKSSWASGGLADIDRPLNARGEKASIQMAGAIADAGCAFDYVVVSPALRAQQTIQGVANLIDFNDWYTEESMYTFDWRALMECVAQLADSYSEALLVGHNPAITEFCNHKSNARIDNVPTCGYARLGFNMESWEDINSTEGELLKFIVPKDLPGMS